MNDITYGLEDFRPVTLVRESKDAILSNAGIIADTVSMNPATCLAVMESEEAKDWMKVCSLSVEPEEPFVTLCNLFDVSRVAIVDNMPLHQIIVSGRPRQ